jgi:uncharacterized heparinase superfamily protein
MTRPGREHRSGLSTTPYCLCRLAGATPTCQSSRTSPGGAAAPAVLIGRTGFPANATRSRRPVSPKTDMARRKAGRTTLGRHRAASGRPSAGPARRKTVLPPAMLHGSAKFSTWRRASKSNEYQAERAAGHLPKILSRRNVHILPAMVGRDLRVATACRGGCFGSELRALPRTDKGGA